LDKTPPQTDPNCRGVRTSKTGIALNKFLGQVSNQTKICPSAKFTGFPAISPKVLQDSADFGVQFRS
jgi:hypothetical protein